MATGALAALPEDALAGVLRRLPAHSLARVCRAWRAVISGRALLPRSVRGVFFNYIDYRRPHLLLARPPSSSLPPPATATPGVDVSFLPIDIERDTWAVVDHCNGLLLLEINWCDLCVCNPATRRRDLLPPPGDAPATPPPCTSPSIQLRRRTTRCY
ncbi:hypothetical protein ACP70R_009203 [Stipagrostis hirtigluma subsp. patula]